MPRPPRRRGHGRRFGALPALALAALLGAPSGASAAAATPAPARHVLVARLDSVLHPVAADFVRQAVTQAEAERAAALVLELDTPGGLLTSTRDITRSLLQSEVPVVVWVGPQGAQAASAGFFVLMAADVAAMAPGTNTGAAHPVGGGGEDIGGAMGKKVEQDAAAQVRSLAARHRRNVELAEKAVLESRSFTAEEALQQRLIEVIAPTLPALLQQIDGRPFTRAEPGAQVRTAGAEVRRLEMGAVQRFLATIAHPNIAYILLTLGFVGLYFELANPGVVLPGVVGAICLLLGFYALSVLPLNYAGVALVALAVVLFMAEVKVTSYGLLTVAGLFSLVLGSLMLFETPDLAVEVSRWLIAAVASALGVVIAFLTTLVVRTHRHRVTTGAEGLLGEYGVARTALSPAGKVFVHGELWRAVAEAPVTVGEPVEVVGREGLTLRVRPLADGQTAAVALTGG
jgi:membrane-bound serine protease (ClpP class)